MTLNIPAEYDARLREAATAAGYDDVGRFVIEKILLGSQSPHQPGEERKGGQWKGQVVIADDFDELPSDLKDAFGMIG